MSNLYFSGPITSRLNMIHILCNLLHLAGSRKVADILYTDTTTDNDT